ncbi:MAG: hypothetical protein JXQ30_02660 [Spirochaetes bacterium]|nr:hypothetical protein [Spirochaetota bacterium]
MNKKPVVFTLVVFAAFAAATLLSAQSYEKLKDLLIDVPGYSGNAPEGMDMTYEDMKAITATREYEKGDSKLHAAIIVGQQASGVWNPSYQKGFKMETSDGLMEVTEKKGFLLFHSYAKDKREGMIAVLIEPAKEAGSGSVFVFSYRGIEDKEGLSLAEKFDWKKIQSRVKGL